jgi:hypothetical protein
MSAQHTPPEGPLIAKPAQTPGGLRRAIAQIAPASLPRFQEHLEQAAEQAAKQGSTAYLRTFLLQWGMFIEIQRYPARAARFRELEDAAQNAPDRESMSAALAEIREIMDAAEREALA